MTDAAWTPDRRPLGAPSVPIPGNPATSPRPTPTGMPGSGVASRPGAPVAAPSAPTPGLPTGAAPVAPAALPPVVETGHPAVDTALARLAVAGDVPAEARAGVFGEVHDQLRDTLAGLDERPGQAPTPLNTVR